MNCKNFHDRISAAVDLYLSDDEMGDFLAHSGKCACCRSEYEIEMITKSVVKGRLGVVQAPEDLVLRITQQIESEEMSAFDNRQAWWRKTSSSVFFKPTIAFALSAVVVIALFNYSKPDSDSISSASIFPLRNLITESVAHYRNIQIAGAQPLFISSTEGHLRSLMTNGTESHVLIPRIAGCTLIGGNIEISSGVEMAHLYYAQGSEILFLCEVPWKVIESGAPFTLPPEAVAELVETGWHVYSDTSGYTAVLWTDGQTLCSLISSLPAETLLRSLGKGDSSRSAW